MDLPPLKYKLGQFCHSAQTMHNFKYFYISQLNEPSCLILRQLSTKISCIHSIPLERLGRYNKAVSDFNRTVMMLSIPISLLRTE